MQCYPRVISSRVRLSERYFRRPTHCHCVHYIFAALYLNFPCVGRTGDDVTGILIVPLLLLFFLDYVFTESSRDRCSSRGCFRRRPRAKIPLSSFQSQWMGLFPGEKGKRSIYIPAEYPINYQDRIL